MMCKACWLPGRAESSSPHGSCRRGSKIPVKCPYFQCFN
uniref:Uncharacterized protein n=1 Tax=Leptobrachium leishanense TaxID=445787 RepID=A0A8C5LMC1_9ANUR